MPNINLSAIDLNLLVVFDAIMSERSVSNAARRLNLTQPALSHALNRLRALFGDPLFIRSPTGMRPTAFAEHIAARVASVLQEVHIILSPADEFDASRSNRRFVIGMTDYVAYVLMPELTRRQQTLAPDIELLIRPASRGNGVAMIEQNEVDLVIVGAPKNLPRFISSSPLLLEHSVCAARRGHPAFAGKLTAKSYLAWPHLHISPWGEPGYIDEMLARHQASRRIAVTIGHFLLAPAILEKTDLIATMPRRIAQPMSERFNLALAPPPFDLGQTEIMQIWHRRFDDDHSLRWLRQQITATAAEL